MDKENEWIKIHSLPERGIKCKIKMLNGEIVEDCFYDNFQECFINKIDERTSFIKVDWIESWCKQITHSDTCTFKRNDSSEKILQGMELSKEEMKKQGVWREDINFEEWNKWAGSHCVINESSDV